MKILYVGQINPRGWVSTTRMRMEELLRLGHDVVPVDTLPFYHWGGRLLAAAAHRLKWGPAFWGLNRAVRAAARRCRPDVLWVDKGVWVARRTLRGARSAGVRVLVHYTPDPAFVFHRSRHFLGAVPEYDLLVTTKAYEVEHYRRHGARDVLLQYPSYDRDVHRPETPTPEEARRYTADVVFVGNYGPGRERFLTPLAHLGIDLALWGRNWDACPVPEVRRHVRGGVVGGRDYALALGCGRIGLGLLSPLCPDRSTTRSLEIPACGTFLLAERTEEHQALFEEGREAAFFSSEEELAAKVRHYLADDEARRQIAAAGRQRCLASRYSSGDRVREIVEKVAPLLEGRWVEAGTGAVRACGAC